MLLASVRIQPSDRHSANEACALHRPTRNPPPRNTVECRVLPRQIVQSTSRYIRHQVGLSGTEGLSNTNTDTSGIGSEERIGMNGGELRTGVGV